MTVTEELALEHALEADRRIASGNVQPLTGIPVQVKDNMCTRGIPTTCSSRMLEGFVPPYDATVVTRLYEQGAVLVGKGNLDEFAMGSSTENSSLFPTRNPWGPGQGPGRKQRRPGGGGGRGRVYILSGLRYRRKYSPAGRALRRGWAEADLWPGQPIWAGSVRQFPGPDRTGDERCHRFRSWCLMPLRATTPPIRHPSITMFPTTPAPSTGTCQAFANRGSSGVLCPGNSARCRARGAQGHPGAGRPWRRGRGNQPCPIHPTPWRCTTSSPPPRPRPTSPATMA